MCPAQNPDRTFIACEYFDESGKKSGGCGALYHPRCVGTSRKIVDGIGEFKCSVVCARERKGWQNNGSNAGSSVDFRRVTSNWRKQKFLPNLERLCRIDPKPLCLALSNANVIQDAASPIATLPGAIGSTQGWRQSRE